MSSKNISWCSFLFIQTWDWVKQGTRSHKMTSSAHPAVALGQAARQSGGPGRRHWDWPETETGDWRQDSPGRWSQESTQHPDNQSQPQHGRLGDVPKGKGHLRPEQVRGGPQCGGISSWGNKTECHCHQRSVFGLYLKCDECLYNPEVIKGKQMISHYHWA